MLQLKLPFKKIPESHQNITFRSTKQRLDFDFRSHELPPPPPCSHTFPPSTFDRKFGNMWAGGGGAINWVRDFIAPLLLGVGGHFGSAKEQRLIFLGEKTKFSHIRAHKIDIGRFENFLASLIHLPGGNRARSS